MGIILQCKVNLSAFEDFFDQLFQCPNPSSNIRNLPIRQICRSQTGPHI
jgi:hypothetical protein